jgi:hypothetical protein
MEPLHNLESVCTPKTRNILHLTLEKGFNAKNFSFPAM